MVKIAGDQGLDEMATNLRAMLLRHREAFQHATYSWKENLLEALAPQPGVDNDGNEMEIGFSDWTFHYLTVFWKILFCLVPPTVYHGGWMTFIFSLIFIALTTMIAGELASLFGCSVGLTDSITAITFVALGTSLPDTFASRNAAKEVTCSLERCACNAITKGSCHSSTSASLVQADDADAAIGNVTGSNSVNVLLGLGLPWVIGAIYYAANPQLTGGVYCVPSGTLAYSVIIFSVCAVVCIALLFARRRYVGGELGGSPLTKWSSFIILFLLWIFYIVMSALQAHGHVEFGSASYVLDAYGCRVYTAEP